MGDLWSERLKEHPFHSEVALTQNTLTRLLQDVELPQEQVDYLRRAENVLKNLTWRVERADGRLTPITALEGAANQIRKARATLDEFSTDRSQAHLERLDLQIDAALAQLRALPPLQFRVGEEAATNAAESYAETLRGLEASVRAQFRELSGDIEALASEAEPVRAELDRMKAEADQKVKEVTQQTEARIAEVRTEIDAQKLRLDQAISAEQAQFTEGQRQRLTDFAETQKVLEGSFESQTEQLLNAHRKELELIVTSAEGARTKLLEHEQEAARVLGLVSASKVAGAYVEEAERQGRQANVWRMAAIFSALALRGEHCWYLYSLLRPQIRWKTF